MKLDQFMKRIGVNQSKLAETLGVTPASITKWKNGGGVDLSYLDHLLRLGMNIEEMFSDEAWEAIKRFRADDLKNDVYLSPEECAKIVLSGMEKMKEQGQEIVALRKVR